MINRWLWIGLALTFLGIFALQSWLGGVRSERLQSENFLVERVNAQVPLKSVRAVEHFRGEQEWTIVWGQTNTDIPIVAWISGSTLQIDRNPTFMTRDAIESRFLNGLRSAEIIRLSPGIVRGKKIWEVYYRKNVETKDAFGYVYYDWHTGERLDHYYLAHLEK